MQHGAESTTAANAALAQEATNLEAKLRSLATAPSRAQSLEGERGLLVEDVKKFEKVVETWGAKVAMMEARLGEREMELEKKEGEVRRLKADNVELKQRVDAQGVSARDVERMRRELQAIERDIAEAECERNAAEDKAWELEADVGRRFKEVEAMAVQCNQAIRKLKLGKDFEYVPNAKGSSPAEVMGFDYKATLKPALNKLVDDTNKTSVSKLDELMNLQNKSLGVAAVLEDKRKSLATLQAKCDEAEGRLSLVKKEIEDHTSKLAAEAGKIREEFTRKEQELEILEKEAGNFLKGCEQRLQEAVRESEDKTQICAQELLAVIDSVSEYKEYMESTIRGMKKDLGGTAQVVAEVHKAFVSVKLVSSAPNLNGGLKRARCSPPN